MSASNKRDGDGLLRNESIKALSVRLIDSEGEQVGIVSKEKALELAQSQDLDLVEISPTAKPPVCRIMDYGKYIYEQGKRQQEAKRNQKQIQVKELKFRPTTEEGDYQVKLRNLIRFLEHGDKVKITLRFRGREMVHQDIGMKVIERLLQDTATYAVVEQQAKREGRQLLMVLAPKKKAS